MLLCTALYLFLAAANKSFSYNKGSLLLVAERCLLCLFSCVQLDVRKHKRSRLQHKQWIEQKESPCVWAMNGKYKASGSSSPVHQFFCQPCTVAGQQTFRSAYEVTSRTSLQTCLPGRCRLFKVCLRYTALSAVSHSHVTQCKAVPCTHQAAARYQR